MPLTWVFLLLFLSLFSKKAKRKKAFLIGAIATLLLFSNEFIINQLFKAWEPASPPIESLNQYEVGIVLTGIAKPMIEYPDRVFFNKGADRLLHTVQLYKEGKIKKILVSGGSGNVVGREVYEADELKKVFLYCGVPESDLIIENRSRNTRENALFTKNVLDSLHIKGDLLLITSAFHMHRAEGCFLQAGLYPTPFPVDYWQSDDKYTPDKLIIPSEGAITKWQVLMHELLGYIVYKILGYA